LRGHHRYFFGSTSEEEEIGQEVVAGNALVDFPCYHTLSLLFKWLVSCLPDCRCISPKRGEGGRLRIEFRDSSFDYAHLSMEGAAGWVCCKEVRCQLCTRLIS